MARSARRSSRFGESSWVLLRSPGTRGLLLASPLTRLDDWPASASTSRARNPPRHRGDDTDGTVGHLPTHADSQPAVTLVRGHETQFAGSAARRRTGLGGCPPALPRPPMIDSRTRSSVIASAAKSARAAVGPPRGHSDSARVRPRTPRVLLKGRFTHGLAVQHFAYLPPSISGAKGLGRNAISCLRNPVTQDRVAM